MINSLSKTDDFIKMINSFSKTDDFAKTPPTQFKTSKKNSLFYKNNKIS